ncbi:uncharacterized protein LOC131435178 [Malaya genurostris]|uniref:uncharacterized protein LOC131435178 n=1 Tax=Malaya genurostris TaxID=325434 RepID=UPI0026F37F79|nr:uncharacterized protein LOC131435178 [Malaya genurostris]
MVFQFFDLLETMEDQSQNSSEQFWVNKSTEVILYPDLFPDEPPSLEAEIIRGTKELKKRRKSHKQVQLSRKKAARKETPKVMKLIFPRPPKFRGCRHNENIIIDRDILKPSEHIRLLAKPRVKPPPQYARFVIKTIPAPTNQIKTLAQPKPCRVQHTITHHGNHLKPEQLERMNQHLNARDYLTLSESRKYARQQRRDEKMWLRHRQRQARMLKSRIIRLELGYLRDIMGTVYRKTRDYFLSEENSKLENELSLASEVILVRLCNLIAVDVPQRDSENILDKYYCEMADKLALWMWRIMQSCAMTFERPEDVEKRLSAASSVFEDPTGLREADEVEEIVEEEILVVDEATRDVAMGMLEICLTTALLAVHEMESQNTDSLPYDVPDGHSVSQTVVICVPSQETANIDREKGSKVNFMPRKSAAVE